MAKLISKCPGCKGRSDNLYAAMFLLWDGIKNNFDLSPFDQLEF